jgi:Uma2 family endonuclease
VPFHAKHGVDELLIVDPQKRRVDWLGLTPAGEYAPIEGRRLIDLLPARLAEQLDWPA